MDVSERIKKILSPLEPYRSQYCVWDGRHSMSGWSTTDNIPTISHSDFFIQAVFSRLTEVFARFGQEGVVQNLVDIALPLYEPLKADEMAGFWEHTIVGEYRGISANRINSALAAEYGIRAVYGPILSLAAVHAETKVFPSLFKFFSCQACRMGEVIARFGYDGLFAYTKLAKKLLRSGVYDWSVEFNPEQWDALEPSCRKYGLQQVLEPMVDAMAALGHVPGANHGKYKWSYLNKTVEDLFPYMLPRVMERGPEAISETLVPITDFVLELHEKGAFADPYPAERIGRDFFFGSFGKLIPRIEERGIGAVLKGSQMTWESLLVPSGI
jgi:hypothetical protein